MIPSLERNAMINVVGEHLFFKSDPRGDNQTYHDLAAELREDRLKERYKEALADINVEVMQALESGEIDLGSAKKDEFSKSYFTANVLGYFMANAKNKGQKNQLRDDILNLNEAVYVSGTEVTGKTVAKEVYLDCIMITKFTDNTYRVIGGVNGGEIELEHKYSVAQLEQMLRDN